MMNDSDVDFAGYMLLNPEWLREAHYRVPIERAEFGGDVIMELTRLTRFCFAPTEI
jgi:hypothetical protein